MGFVGSGRWRVQCVLSEDRAAASLLSPLPAPRSSRAAQDALRGGASWVLPAAAVGAFTAVNSHGCSRGMHVGYFSALQRRRIDGGKTWPRLQRSSPGGDRMGHFLKDRKTRCGNMGH